MTFADLAVGVSIFLDANPLVYHFASDPVFGPASNQLITRIENREIHAFTSTHVLSETAHHLMTLEASGALRLVVQGGAAPPSGPIRGATTDQVPPRDCPGATARYSSSGDSGVAH